MEVPEPRATSFSLFSPKADPLPTLTEPRTHTLVVASPVEGQTGEMCVHSSELSGREIPESWVATVWFRRSRQVPCYWMPWITWSSCVGGAYLEERWRESLNQSFPEPASSAPADSLQMQVLSTLAPDLWNHWLHFNSIAENSICTAPRTGVMDAWMEEWHPPSLLVQIQAPCSFLATCNSVRTS